MGIIPYVLDVNQAIQMLIKGFSGNMVYCFVCIFLNGLTTLLLKILASRATCIENHSAVSQEDVVLYFLNLFLLLKILMGANEYTVKYGTIAKCKG